MEKQLGGSKEDLVEFKDITKRYTDQLVKVKVRRVDSCIASSSIQTFLLQMADMANADLEKYAKALDKCVYDSYEKNFA